MTLHEPVACRSISLAALSALGPLADRDTWMRQESDNTLLDGRFRVIAANTGEAIDLGWLSDRIANIPSVQWLVTRVAVAVNWPSDWVVLSASDVEYRSYRRSFGRAVEDSSAVTKEDTSLIELSEPGQLLELTATILDVEDDRWICHLCKQYLNGPRLLAEHLDQRRHLTKLGMLQDAEIRAHRVVRLVQWARTATVGHVIPRYWH